MTNTQEHGEPSPANNVVPDPPKKNCCANQGSDKELELLKIRLDYAWNWFSYHAEQRTKMFNFMLIVVGVFATAVVSALKEGMADIAFVLCFVPGFLALIFMLLDGRNGTLVRLGEDVLRELERKRLFGEEAKIEIEDADHEKKNVPYGILWRQTREEKADRPHQGRVGKWLRNAWLFIRNAGLGKHRVWLRAIAFLLAALFFIGAYFIHSRPQDLAAHSASIVLLPDPLVASEFTRGWRAPESSPSFAIGAVRFDTAVTGCPPPDNTMNAANEWIGRVVDAWKKRTHASPDDSIIVIGAADRIFLNSGLKRQYESNVGLARNRAETVKAMLIKATTQETRDHKLTEDRVMVLVTGPRFQALAESTGKIARSSCTDSELAKDRTVQVWLPSGT